MDGQVAQSDNNNLLLYQVGTSKVRGDRRTASLCAVWGSHAYDCIALALAG